MVCGPLEVFIAKQEKKAGSQAAVCCTVAFHINNLVRLAIVGFIVIEVDNTSFSCIEEKVRLTPYF
jgi:hypothetical protein